MGWWAKVLEEVPAVMSSVDALNVWPLLSSLSLFLLVVVIFLCWVSQLPPDVPVSRFAMPPYPVSLLWWPCSSLA